jgi:integrase
MLATAAAPRRNTQGRLAQAAALLWARLARPTSSPDRPGFAHGSHPRLVSALEGAREAHRWNLRRLDGVELTAEQIALWLARAPLSPTTKRNTLKSLRYVLGRAVDFGLIDANPAAKVEMPREPVYRPEPFRSWDEVRKVSEAASKERDRSLILFACATDLRPQEWIALRWEDVGGTAVTVSRALKTPGSLRRVLLTDLAREALELAPRNGGLVFGRLYLHSWRTRPRKTTLARAGVDYRPPSAMRDTYATLALEAGARVE